MRFSFKLFSPVSFCQPVAWQTGPESSEWSCLDQAWARIATVRGQKLARVRTQLHKDDTTNSRTRLYVDIKESLSQP